MATPTGTKCQSLTPCQWELVSSLLRPRETFQTIFKTSLFLRNSPSFEESPAWAASLWQHAALARGQQLRRSTSSLLIPTSVFCCPDRHLLLGTNNDSPSAITLGPIYIATHDKKGLRCSSQDPRHPLSCHRGSQHTPKHRTKTVPVAPPPASRPFHRAATPGTQPAKSKLHLPESY